MGGPDDNKPEFKTSTWIAMIFSAAMGASVLSWAAIVILPGPTSQIFNSIYHSIFGSDAQSSPDSERTDPGKNTNQNRLQH
ncbi:BCCT family transporter [Desulfocicer niacini]